MKNKVAKNKLLLQLPKVTARGSSEGFWLFWLVAIFVGAIIVRATALHDTVIDGISWNTELIAGFVFIGLTIGVAIINRLNVVIVELKKLNATTQEPKPTKL